MKIHILSDLHNEFSVFKPPRTDADVVILAGDIDNGCKGIRWAAKSFDIPALYVAGNHEFYGRDIGGEIAALREAADGTNVRFLDCDAVGFGGVRFLGATLWTNFALNGDSPHQIAGAKDIARRSMNDFRRIELNGAKFTPDDSVVLFDAAVKFLRAELEKPFDGKTVLVTHHSPSPQSVHAKYTGDPLNAAFSSNIEFLMQGSNAPAVWIHGHTHDSYDYMVNSRTRVIANPRGYSSSFISDGQENEFFKPDFTIEI